MNKNIQSVYGPEVQFPENFQEQKILVAGAGGFIGGHLVADLLRRGCRQIVAVDLKPKDEWYQYFSDVDNRIMDLRNEDACFDASRGCDRIYNLACNMGGMGFIENNKAACMRSVLINTHLLEAARINQCDRYFYSSTACVYAADKQSTPDVAPLKEEDAYPAMPEDGYGWEKLFSERLCRHYTEDYGVVTRIARLHNVYGPHGTFDGGREKAPAALCRKIGLCKLKRELSFEIWGDGEQTRSFMYIDDCITGIHLITESDEWCDPINLGSAEMMSINQLAKVIEGIADIDLEHQYNLDAPKGVRGRSSDNTLIQKVFGWQPSVTLEDGLSKTYDWIFQELLKQRANLR
ncbi:MAG: NAD-dependent epimerase/dehydratase family protein [Verrucomicrobiae bacterium]|nr:NAD-dependent epimerase/dehydratase family protein [Verrucomicrobiae bacterium]NNJ44003.1 NAD-dependent epimerase/dehydratase family protein [Akkermansiaceae bacterium]